MRNKNKKILIITGGPIKKLDDFKEVMSKSKVKFSLASFSDLEYYSGEKEFTLRVKGEDVKNYDAVYIRMIGKRLEDASLLVNYAIENGISLVDKVYNKAYLMPSTISKAVEMKNLINAGISIPPTFFGSLAMIDDRAEKILGFPYVIKSTMGKKARDAWAPKDKKALGELVSELREREKRGERFFAQKLIYASQRARILVIGDKAIGAITRPTKWRKRWTEKVDGEYPEGKKEALNPVPNMYAKIAVKAAKSVNLDISGVDILEEDGTGRLYVIEANAAPSWKLIKKDTGINIEEEILKFLASLS